MTSDPVPVVSTSVVPAPQVPAPPQEPGAPACANCGAPLSGEFCAACGQRDEARVHSVRHFFAEAFESITHADSRLWRTLGYLLVKPGRLTLEFFQGHRVRYLPPFRLYLVISLLFFVIAGLPDPNDKYEESPIAGDVQGMKDAARTLEKELKDTPGAAEAAAALLAEAARQEAAARGGKTDDDDVKESVRRGLQENNAFTEFCEAFDEAAPGASANYMRLYNFCRKSARDRGSQLWETVAHNVPRAMFVFLPLLALTMKLLYWRPKRYYVEHLLLLVHNHAFVFLTLAIVGLLTRIPVVGAYLGTLEFAVWLYMIWYVFRAMRNYYEQSRILTLGKYFILAMAYFSTSLLVLLFTVVFSAVTM